MNIEVLFTCLSTEEKDELRVLLDKEEFAKPNADPQKIEAAGISVEEWAEINRNKMSARLYNNLIGPHGYYKDIAVKNLKHIDFMRIRNAGEKGWKEFVALRGF